MGVGKPLEMNSFSLPLSNSMQIELSDSLKKEFEASVLYAQALDAFVEKKVKELTQLRESLAIDLPF